MVGLSKKMQYTDQTEDEYRKKIARYLNEAGVPEISVEPPELLDVAGSVASEATEIFGGSSTTRTTKSRNLLSLLKEKLGRRKNGSNTNNQ